MARPLRAHGFDTVANPESFLLTKENRLAPPEAARAREWGAELAASIVPGQPASSG